MSRQRSGLRHHYEALPSLAEAYSGPAGVGLLPGGFGRSTFALGGRIPMARSGNGHRIIDETGRSLVDLNNNFTALIHGNAHPVVSEAGRRALMDGASFGLPGFPELDLATALLQRMPYVHQVRFCNSGTEAVMLGVRLARAAVGRDMVVFVRCAYHGSSDVALVPGGPPSRRGVPAGVVRDVLEVGVNDVTGLQDTFASHGARIAAVVVDPMPNRAGLVGATSEFLREIRSQCDSNGALLLADEVISLRQAYSGATFSAGVVPDLVIAGKIIGGGLPVGAVLGTHDLMAQLDPRSGSGLEHGGTFSGNPVTMASGIAAMSLFTQPEVARLNQLGDLVRERIAGPLLAQGWEVRGAGSLFRAFPQGVGPDEVRSMQTDLWWTAYERGLLLTPNTLCSLSTPMEDEIVRDVGDRFVDAVIAADVRPRSSPGR